jgi:hypothetical protein
LNELLHKLCDQALEKKTKVSRAPKMNSRAEIERQVWRRDGQKCTNCQSTHAVQVEHIITAEVGGPFTLENLCLLCRSFNQRRAIEYFGLLKMDRYINGSGPGSRDASVSKKADGGQSELHPWAITTPRGAPWAIVSNFFKVPGSLSGSRHSIGLDKS